MTPLSWAHGRRSGRIGGNRWNVGPTGRWHVACIPLLASGCLYLGPIPTLEDNVPPEVVRAEPLPDDETAVLIGPAGQSVFVLAKDREGDELRFAWSLSQTGIVGSAHPVFDGEGSQVDLAHDPELHGQILSCYIDDGENELVTTKWKLEVW